jgi:hypothetical protein
MLCQAFLGAGAEKPERITILVNSDSRSMGHLNVWPSEIQLTINQTRQFFIQRRGYSSIINSASDIAS